MRLSSFDARIFSLAIAPAAISFAKLSDLADGKAERKGRIPDLNRIHGRNELWAGDVIFSATSIADVSIVKGVWLRPGYTKKEITPIQSRCRWVRPRKGE